MKLDLMAIKINRCEFRNDMGPNTKLNLQVNFSNQIKIPNKNNKNCSGSIISRVMVGSPMHPLYLFFEQVAAFADSDRDNLEISTEELMSLYKTICIPVAQKEVENTINRLCEVYRIPKIQINNAQSQPGAGNYMN